MALDFTVKDIMHKITAKFVHATLPDAKKPYTLKAVLQPELDVHGIASKADVYNIETDPKVIEEGFNAAAELIYYLTADGYKIKTPLFNTRVRLPGEYDGDETSLHKGAPPEVHMQRALPFREFIKTHCEAQIDGIEDENGHIGSAVDEKTGEVDEVATIGNLLTIHGYGLKIEHDEDHPTQTGVFFQGASGPPPKAEIIAVNESRTLKIIVPALTPGAEYTLRIFTQSSAKTTGALLKNVRDMRSDFKLTAQQ